MEYRQAAETGKKCLIFLLDEDAPWPRKFMDHDGRIEKLRDELSKKHTCAFFKSPEDIGSVVGPAVYNWAKEHGHISAGALIPAFDLSAYFNALRKRYQRLNLEGLTPPQKEEYLQLQLRSVFVEQSVRENPPPVELSKEVWEKLHREKEIHSEDLPEGITIEDIRQAREAYYGKPTRPVLDVLTDSRHQYVVILGDPGSGKSTLARYVLLSLIDPVSDEKLHRAFDGYLPLLIELRSYAGLCADNKCNSFLEFLEYMGKAEGWHLTASALHQHLESDGRAVVIFDGLDEVFDPEERERITRQVVGFASNYPKARIVATSRIIGYRRKILTDADFTHFTLQDLDESQVDTFVNRWYGLALSDRPEEIKERRERILRSFKESASIRQLAGNPMLLTIMAIISKHQELPRERWKLYDHAAGVLIEHWDVNKHLKDQRVQADFIGEDEKKEMLRRLAFKMQSGAGGLAGNYIHHEELQKEFESYLKERHSIQPDRATTIARAIIDQFRKRNFILSLFGANLYGFVHRAFLEYFCATAFVYEFEKKREMTLEQLKREVYGEHWEDQSWHEVLRLICGIIDEKFAAEIIDYLGHEIYQPWPERFDKRPPWNIALAVQCLNEVRNLSTITEPAKRLLELLCSFFDHLMKSPMTREAYDFIKEQIALPSGLIGKNWPHRDLLVDWMNGSRSFRGDQLDSEMLGDFIGSVASGLDRAYGVLLEYAGDSQMQKRIIAVRAIIIGWIGDPQTLPLLRDWATNAADEDVRSTAVTALAQYFRDDPQTLPLLCDRAVNDESPSADAPNTIYYVREAAIEAITQYWPLHPDTLPLLRERAENDPTEWLREKAKRLADRLSVNAES